MNTKKILALALGGTLLVGCLTGCGTAAASLGGTPPLGAAVPQTSDTPVQIAVANAESDGIAAIVSYEELFKPYEQFGLIYDSGKRSCNIRAGRFDGSRTTTLPLTEHRLEMTFSMRMAWLMCMLFVTSPALSAPKMVLSIPAESWSV